MDFASTGVALGALAAGVAGGFGAVAVGRLAGHRGEIADAGAAAA